MWSAPRGFFLVGLFEVVRADYRILRIEREELDTARRQIELERRERLYGSHVAGMVYFSDSLSFRLVG